VVADPLNIELLVIEDRAGIGSHMSTPLIDIVSVMRAIIEHCVVQSQWSLGIR